MRSRALALLAIPFVLTACTTDRPATPREWSGSGTPISTRPTATTAVDNDVVSLVNAVPSCPLCVVSITVGQTRGTGVLIDQDRIVTAAHVMDDDGDIHILFGGRAGRPEFDAAAGQYIEWGYNEEIDLAVITGFAPPTWARPAVVARDTPEQNETLVSIGLERPGAIRIRSGPMTALDSRLPRLYMGVKAQAGDSGGPVFNTRGEVVGINSAIGTYSTETVETFQSGDLTLALVERRTVEATFVVDLTQIDLAEWIP